MITMKVGARVPRAHRRLPGIDTPVAVTRRGETVGVYVRTRRKRPKAAELSELKAAAERLAKALANVDEEELVAELKKMRRRGKGVVR